MRQRHHNGHRRRRLGQGGTFRLSSGALIFHGCVEPEAQPTDCMQHSARDLPAAWQPLLRRCRRPSRPAGPAGPRFLMRLDRGAGNGWQPAACPTSARRCRSGVLAPTLVRCKLCPMGRARSCICLMGSQQLL